MTRFLFELYCIITTNNHTTAFSTLKLSVRHMKKHTACKKISDFSNLQKFHYKYKTMEDPARPAVIIEELIMRTVIQWSCGLCGCKNWI